MKKYQSRKNLAAFQIKLEKFQNNSKKLFDFAFCKCKDMSNCNCAKEFKVPVLESDFINDKRSDRTMYIENCDLTATKLLSKRSLQRQQHPTLTQATFERS